METVNALDLIFLYIEAYFLIRMLVILIKNNILLRVFHRNIKKW